MVWVNEAVNIGLTVNSISVLPMLDPAGDFMVFDTTIVRVVIPTLQFTLSTTNVEGLRQFRWALFTAIDTMDPADATSLFADTIGPPWMATGGSGARFAGNIQQVTFDLVLANGGVIDVKAARRFRENSATLFLQTENVVNAADTNLNITGLVRTLIRIP